jgi:FemAB-related protein (PEP-CTERM system-associated)
MVTTTINPATGVQVRTFEEDLRAAWDGYVDRHPGASLFHLTAWQRVIQRAFAFEARYLLAEDQSGIRGVLPLFLVQNLIQGRTLISTPFAVYGGICAGDDAAQQALCDAARQIAAAEKVQYLELRERWASFDSSFRVKDLYVAFEQDLPSDPEQLLRGFPRDTRYMIRKAEKAGLAAVVDNSQLDVFYEIYAASVHHLGTPVFAKRFFRILLEEFGDLCEITVVWHGKQAVAAVLSFLFRDWILPYYGGSLPEGRRVAANNFMYWEVMKQAVARGFRHFDFGRSKMATGAYAFKTQWNMRQRPLPYMYHLERRKSMPNFSPANPRFQLLTSAWKRLPFSLTKVVGPALVRLFP